MPRMMLLLLIISFNVKTSYKNRTANKAVNIGSSANIKPVSVGGVYFGQSFGK